MLRTLAIVALTVIWTIGLLWGAAQISGGTFDDDIVRVCQERGC
jgi:hypothetical protein